MTEQHRAKPEHWLILGRQAETLGSAESIAILELRSRIEALEASARIGQLAAPANTSPPTTRLHSYKVGEAEPIEDWGKGHTPVNPEAPMTELRAASAEARPAGGLVERVQNVICDIDPPSDWESEARAAIREVAATARDAGLTAAAKWLEQEAGRG